MWFMKILKELIIIFILAIPFAFLGIHWNDIPNEVPLHWNSAGEIDRVGSKMELIHVCVMVNIPVYLILPVSYTHLTLPTIYSV